MNNTYTCNGSDNTNVDRAFINVQITKANNIDDENKEIWFISNATEVYFTKMTTVITLNLSSRILIDKSSSKDWFPCRQKRDYSDYPDGKICIDMENLFSITCEPVLG